MTPGQTQQLKKLVIKALTLEEGDEFEMKYKTTSMFYNHIANLYSLDTELMQRRDYNKGGHFVEMTYDVKITNLKIFLDVLDII